MNTSLMRCCFILLLAFSGLFWMPATHAAITCSATSMSAVTFGSVDPRSSQTNTGATLTYTCTNGNNAQRSATICFSIGEPGGGPTNPREMASGVNTLTFQLYQDAARSVVWGSQFFGASLTPLVVKLTFTANQTLSGKTQPLYGQVLNGQTAAKPGSYSDTYLNGDTAVTINDVAGANAPASCGGTQTGSYFPFNVTATVDKQCTVTATSDINLGAVDSTAVNTSGSNSISVACTNGTAYNVGLAPSNGNTGGAGLMTGTGSNTDKVPYQLKQNSAAGPVWGNTATSSTVGNGVAGTGTGLSQTLIAYATAPGANFTPDSYADTVTINVNY